MLHLATRHGSVLAWAILLQGLAAPVPASLTAQGSTDGAQPFHTWPVTLPYRRGVVIWARNTSQDTVSITQVEVSRCLNIGAGCGLTRLTVVLAPGDSSSTVTIRPRLWDDRYVYQLSWGWQVRSGPAP